MAQIFWGVQLAFALFRIVSPPSGFVALFVLSLSGALSAALPFGVLFGLAHPLHRLRTAVLFATIPALLVLGSAVWVGVWVHPLPSEHHSWPVRLSDAALFAALFPLFAALGARLSPRGHSLLYARLATGTFPVLVGVYYLGFDVYYRYIHAGSV
jgi:hypothetical protein